MRRQLPLDVRERPPEAIKEMWAAAAEAFESICSESLQKGEVKSFEDVQRRIGSNRWALASYGLDAGQVDKWDKGKSVGLKSLKYLKMLVGAASQASSFIPIPAAAANITGTALCFVFDIPGAIKVYNEALDQVFSEVSSALSQFQIYVSMNEVDPLLINQIHLVLVNFVKVCGHVVKYQQDCRRERLLRQLKTIFDDDSGLAGEMTEFKRVLQQQRDVEGTLTLAAIVQTRHHVRELLEQFISFGRPGEETHAAVQETQRGVQVLKDDVDRIKTLVKIRHTLGVPTTVRLDANTTQTCTNIADRCFDGTGAWLWTHAAWAAWTAASNDREPDARVLLVSGPPSSGKTSVCALVTKRLEEQKGRTYVAHHFFPASTNKSDEKNPVTSALKYMAFQIARVDATVQKALGKACDAGPAAFRGTSSGSGPETLDALWGELKIGAPGSGSAYYLVLDGIEQLPDQQAEMLLAFIFGPKLAGEAAGRVHVLLSGTDDVFSLRPPAGARVLRIRTEEHNEPDMRLIVDEALTKRGMLTHARPGSGQQRARDKIVAELVQNVRGSYSRLQFGLDDVIRVLITPSAVRELDGMLEQSTSSHEAAIQALQRLLTTAEISELNELLKWVLFSNEPMTLDQLEAAMFLYSGTESLASLQNIIKNKYTAILKIEAGYVYGQDGVRDYLQKEKDASGRSVHARDGAIISMAITNVDQELCGHFLWDLAHNAVRDKFKFDFDAASSGLHGSSGGHGAIAVDEFEAHHTIVMRAFQYLGKEDGDQTREIGKYLVCWLPYHLDRLRQLEDEDRGALVPQERLEIGKHLYALFRGSAVFSRHKASFEQTWWTVDEMEYVREWLMDSAVVRDRMWRGEVQAAVSHTRGYLKELMRMVVQGMLRERSWGVQSACRWLWAFMEADEKRPQQRPKPSNANADDDTSSGDSFGSGPSSRVIDWGRVSAWCQGILGLPDAALDSLWYERLAEASSLEDSNEPDVTLALYQRAIEKNNPSWLCHRGLGTTHFGQGRTSEAIAQVETAVKEAEREGATPRPEEKDIVELHLLLGQYTYDADSVQRAAEHYLLACGSRDAEQASRGRLGHLKAMLCSPDAEGRRQLLKDMLTQEGGDAHMPNVLKMIGRDAEHDAVVSKLFTAAKSDPDLLKLIARALETATALPAPERDDRTAETLQGDERYAADEVRGVLLYDRGVLAYTYGAIPSSENTSDPVGEALRLWRASRDQLANVGGRNASVARQDAAAALARHYFDIMLEGNNLDHLDELAELATDGPSDASDVWLGDAVGFLGALYALHGESHPARAVLGRRVRQALQILSDDMPGNDAFGFLVLRKTLEQARDFENAAVALALAGQPDLVSEALLHFEARDRGAEEELDSEKRRRLLDVVRALGGRRSRL